MLRIVPIAYKLLATLWPFVRSIVFKDQTVWEAVVNNKQLTSLLVLIVGLSFLLLVAMETLEATRSQLQACQARHAQKVPATATAPKGCPVDEAYDKYHLIDLLRDTP